MVHCGIGKRQRCEATSSFPTGRRRPRVQHVRATGTARRDSSPGWPPRFARCAATSVCSRPLNCPRRSWTRSCDTACQCFATRPQSAGSVRHWAHRCWALGRRQRWPANEAPQSETPPFACDKPRGRCATREALRPGRDSSEARASPHRGLCEIRRGMRSADGGSSCRKSSSPSNLAARAGPSPWRCQRRTQPATSGAGSIARCPLRSIHGAVSPGNHSTQAWKVVQKHGRRRSGRL